LGSRDIGDCPTVHKLNISEEDGDGDLDAYSANGQPDKVW
jgi:hypothetical protein